jgi:pyrroline-5-carboxylate reductase
MVRAGATVIARGKHAKDSDVALAKEILGATGYVTELAESLMDAVTGLSGSGPAYVALMIESLSDGGVKMGLPRAEALRLAIETVRGAAAMLLEKGMHPAQLRDMVTSPGGTTIEGLAVLEKGKVRSSFMSAVEAAAKRSKELGA